MVGVVDDRSRQLFWRSSPRRSLLSKKFLFLTVYCSTVAFTKTRAGSHFIIIVVDSPLKKSQGRYIPPRFCRQLFPFLAHFIPPTPSFEARKSLVAHSHDISVYLISPKVPLGSGGSYSRSKKIKMETSGSLSSVCRHQQSENWKTTTVVWEVWNTASSGKDLQASSRWSHPTPTI